MNGQVKILARPARSRSQSQDLGLVLDCSGRSVTSHGRVMRPYLHSKALFMVSDGLGAHAEPRRAAFQVVRMFGRAFMNSETFSFQRVGEKAHERLQSRSREKGHQKCAGAAMAGIVVREDRCWAFGCGDVNIYIARHDTGFLEAPVFAPDRNVSQRLTNCVGGSFRDGAEIKSVEISDWSMLAICTDGFWEPHEGSIQYHLNEVALSEDHLAPEEDDQAVVMLYRHKER